MGAGAEPDGSGRSTRSQARRTIENPDNSSLPPSKGQKPNKPENAKRVGPRPGSLGRKGGGRPLACDPDETVTAKPVACVHCQAVLTDADQMLHGRYDKIDLPVVRPMGFCCSFAPQGGAPYKPGHGETTTDGSGAAGSILQGSAVHRRGDPVGGPMVSDVPH